MLLVAETLEEESLVENRLAVDCSSLVFRVLSMAFDCVVRKYYDWPFPEWTEWACHVQESED